MALQILGLAEQAGLGRAVGADKVAAAGRQWLCIHVPPLEAAGPLQYFLRGCGVEPTLLCLAPPRCEFEPLAWDSSARGLADGLFLGSVFWGEGPATSDVKPVASLHPRHVSFPDLFYLTVLFHSLQFLGCSKALAGVCLPRVVLFSQQGAMRWAQGCMYQPS